MPVGFATRILGGLDSRGRFVAGENEGVLYRNHIFPCFHCRHDPVLCKYGLYAKLMRGLYRDVAA
uniref:Uncharacterized protein n=1 Tax=Candidatus Kentrum sp. MB TaxID=2138164 RepID=A0A451BED6_9GAMM|nr:MAG: hypothetical protein BECKMB1821G_GA0114241_10088 [Candidatus Kentron sp. MB]VFK34302.1 MAG: hypothetical protein BECKMB1821I_GA0114274_10677 [Candidatus Kentron sp. MB]VFK76641.1 MAG: hypothetical protein BECKMB1821H_GA0114242_10667 [Candidatus Kentron sp. MB]